MDTIGLVTLMGLGALVGRAAWNRFRGGGDETCDGTCEADALDVSACESSGEAFERAAGAFRGAYLYARTAGGRGPAEAVTLAADAFRLAYTRDEPPPNAAPARVVVPFRRPPSPRPAAACVPDLSN